jgi:hypothetical protein
MGDVPALILVAIILAVLMPRDRWHCGKSLSSERPREFAPCSRSGISIRAINSAIIAGPNLGDCAKCLFAELLIDCLDELRRQAVEAQ